MSGQLHLAYRFATEAQWQVCQFAGADRRTAEARKGLRPFAPFGLPPKTLWTGLAFAPALNDRFELVWRDPEQRFWTLPFGAEAAESRTAPVGIASAMRLVASPDMLWALGADRVVRAFDSESLALLFTADLGDLKAIDIASDSHDGLYILGQDGCSFYVQHFGCSGNLDQTLSLEGVRDASALAFLGVPQTLIVLASDGSKLHFVDTHSARGMKTILMSTLRSCFRITAIGSDHCSRLFIGGTDGKAIGGNHHVLIVDEDGGLLGMLPVAAPIVGIGANRSQLFLATKEGVFQFDPAVTVPQGVGEVKARVTTPILQSSAQGPQKWIRADAAVKLPVGCSMNISCRSASDSASARTYTYRGDASEPGEVVLSAPLHDISDEQISIEIELIAAPGGQLPALSELHVHYPGATLIEHLPAIYRTGELESGDFTRALVGVLEAGTQDLDEKIGSLGRRIDPNFADDAWLDYVAGWLGLPWDNALSTDQKRRIVSRGAAIVRGYSTRRGLEELLECLIPGSPRRFRVTDVTAQFGVATIGGGGCDGSKLPAVLAGLPATAMELGNKAILGQGRLPCGDSGPDSARLTGRIRIDIAASAEERASWSPFLGRLIEAMIPATVRAELRWLSPAEFRPGQIDEDARISDEPAARLGSESVTGSSRLSGRSRTILPSKLTQDSRLQ